MPHVHSLGISRISECERLKASLQAVATSWGNGKRQEMTSSGWKMKERKCCRCPSFIMGKDPLPFSSSFSPYPPVIKSSFPECLLQKVLRIRNEEKNKKPHDSRHCDSSSSRITGWQAKERVSEAEETRDESIDHAAGFTFKLRCYCRSSSHSLFSILSSLLILPSIRPPLSCPD